MKFNPQQGYFGFISNFLFIFCNFDGSLNLNLIIFNLHESQDRNKLLFSEFFVILKHPSFDVKKRFDVFTTSIACSNPSVSNGEI